MLTPFIKLLNPKEFHRRVTGPLSRGIKARFTRLFLVLVFLNIVCQSILTAIPALSPLQHTLLNIAMVVLSVYIAYRFGYLGMAYTVPANLYMAVVIIVVAFLAGKDFYMDIASFFIGMAIVTVIIAYLSEQQKKYIEKLEWLSVMDGLTEVYNHRYFQKRMNEEFSRAQSNKSTLGLIMIDLDYFKRYNDKYGHREGDLLLKKAAEVFNSQKRLQDIVSRYGGDEFAILLPEASFEAILSMIEHIREEFARLSLTGDGGVLRERATLSIGYSLYPDLADSIETLISQADTALYQAKNLGRNNVQIYRDVFEDVKQFFDSNEHELIGGLKALLGTVSAKDKYTLGHSERVLDYTTMIAREMGLPDEKIRMMKIAALLHDIGKVEIPEAILNKRGPLAEEEYELIRKHPDYSVDILEPMSDMKLLIKVIKHHHERYDGQGYPDSIRGEEIPLEARILTVADAFDAMLSNRPYRKSLGLDEAVRELKKCSGTQFDPEVVRAFLRAMEILGQV